MKARLVGHARLQRAAHRLPPKGRTRLSSDKHWQRGLTRGKPVTPVLSAALVVWAKAFDSLAGFSFPTMRAQANVSSWSGSTQHTKTSATSPGILGHRHFDSREGFLGSVSGAWPGIIFLICGHSNSITHTVVPTQPNLKCGKASFSSCIHPLIAARLPDLLYPQQPRT